MNKLAILPLIVILLFVNSVSAAVVIGADQPAVNNIFILNNSDASFLELGDTPGAYTGDGSKCVKVNAGETALEFVDCGGGGDFSFTDFEASFADNFSSAFTTNITGLNFTTGWIQLFNWTNVTITQSQITDLVSGGGDFYHDNFTASFADNFTESFNSNFTDLNFTTGWIQLFNWTNVTITQSQITDLSVSGGDFYHDNFTTAFDANLTLASFSDFNHSDFEASFADNFSSAFTSNFTDLNFTTGWIQLFNWTNVTITQSQITDLVAGGGDFYQDNFTFAFADNFSSAFDTNLTAASFSDFNHSDFEEAFENNFSLSFTSNMTGQNHTVEWIQMTNWTNVTITQSQITDFAGGGDFYHDNFTTAFDANLTLASFSDFNHSDFEASFADNFSSAFTSNFTDLNFTTGWIQLFNWTNVTITQSQITDFVGGGDFYHDNFTTAFDANLTLASFSDFNHSDFEAAFEANTTTLTFSDFNFTDFQASFDSNISDSNQTFEWLQADNWTNITITQSQITDFAGGGDFYFDNFTDSFDSNFSAALDLSTYGDFNSSQFGGAFEANTSLLTFSDFNFTDFQGSFDSNFTDLNFTTSWIQLFNWTNVTITQSQITDLVAGGGDFYQDNFTFAFADNFTSAFDTNLTAASFSDFNHSDFEEAFENNFSLAFTSNMTGQNHTVEWIQMTNWTNVTITESQITDFSGGGDFSFTDFQASFEDNFTDSFDSNFSAALDLSTYGDFNSSQFSGAFTSNMTGQNHTVEWIQMTNWTNVTITQSQITDLSVSGGDFFHDNFTGSFDSNFSASLDLSAYGDFNSSQFKTAFDNNISGAGLTNHWGSNGSVIFNATTDGLGIGTDTPHTLLALRSGDPIISLNNTDPTIQADQELGSVDFLASDVSNGGAGGGIMARVVAYSKSTVGKFGNLGFFTANATVEGPLTERMTIDYEGNVGIGTDAPGTLLDIKDTAPTLRLTDERTDAGWNSGRILGSLQYYTSDTSGAGARVVAEIRTVDGGSQSTGPSGEMAFYTSPNVANIVEAMRIDNAGNVGIGTATPSAKLEINSGATTTTPLNVSGVDTNTNEIARFEGNGAGYARFSIDTVTGEDSQFSLMEAGSTKWSFGNDGTDDSFHINNAAGAFGASDEFIFLAGSESPVIMFSGRGSSENNVFGSIDFQNIDGDHAGTDETVRITALGGVANGAGGKLSFWTATEDNTATQKLIIDEVGNVGIGTSTPAHKLQVVGGFNMTNSSGFGTHTNTTCVITTVGATTFNVCI